MTTPAAWPRYQRWHVDGFRVSILLYKSHRWQRCDTCGQPSAVRREHRCDHCTDPARYTVANVRVASINADNYSERTETHIGHKAHMLAVTFHCPAHWPSEGDRAA